MLADEAGADGTATYHNPPGTFASVADTSALRPPQSRPCPLQGYAPVCGRDGVTYGDECDAHWIGWVEKAHDGPCP